MSAAPTELTMTRSTRALKAPRWLPWAALMVVALLFRFPVLLNAGALNSDAAVVGLQARHLLSGEWSWFLWGADYQGSFDVALAAVGMAILGTNAVVLVLVPLAGQLLVLTMAHRVLRRRVGAWPAAILALVLVFEPLPVTYNLSFAARESAIALIFVAFALVDGASSARRPALRRALGCSLGVLSLYLDLYTIQLLPGLALLALLTAFDESPTRRQVLERLAHCAAGALPALVIVLLVRGDATTFGFSDLNAIPRNLHLLWHDCLPWLLSTQVLIPAPDLGLDRWEPGFLFRVIQLAGAALFVAALVSGWLLALWRRVPWEVRRIGVAGFVMALTSLMAFILSSRPVDHWSARYLAPIVLAAPFAAAPLASWLGPRRLTAVILPYLIASLVGGWLSHGPFLDGVVPTISERAEGTDEQRLAELLRQRGVRYGAAHYWLAYRLTFLFEEDPILVPFEAGSDRYPPFRAAYEASPEVAWVFHPREPRAVAADYEGELRRRGKSYQRAEVAGFTVLFVTRTPTGGAR